MFNPNMIETTHNLDALIKAAQLHPTEAIRDCLIEKEIDNHGNFVGFAEAAYIWHKLIPDAA